MKNDEYFPLHILKLHVEDEWTNLKKCLIDLSSDSVETRKKAVMILGKYDRPVAFLNIIAALGDKHEKYYRVEASDK